jgi:putative ABC transport system permease protein
MLVLKIAWRSVLRHRGKSIIIGTILFLAAFIMTLGNSVAIGMQRGIEENLVRSFTGHIILASNEETKDNILFTPMAKPLKILKDYERIRDVLKKQGFIHDFLPMTRGGAAILGGKSMSFLLTFGCNFDDFQRVFDKPVISLEGSLLTAGDHGLLVNANWRKSLYRMQDFWLVPEGHELDQASLTDEAKKELPKLEIKRSLALEGFGEPNSTSKEIPVRGITRFRSLNNMASIITIIDIESYREIFGYFTARDIVQDLPPAQNALLSAEEDDLFGSADIYSKGSTASSVSELEKKIRTQTTTVRKIDFDNAAFNYISVLLNPGEDINKSVEKLRRVAKENNLPVKVLSWKTAAGQVAQMSDILQIILFVFVILLFIVAIIIIMNTLSMNALERTEEFGMMRAVGARKSFISKMFLAETFSLSFIFGGAGIFAGAIVTWIVRPLRITSGNSEIFELLFGGDVLRPSLGVAGLVIGVVSLAIVTFLAAILPLVVARRITPLDAINRH